MFMKTFEETRLQQVLFERVKQIRIADDPVLQLFYLILYQKSRLLVLLKVFL